MRYYQAQDTFVADMDDGTQQRVVKGEPRPESDELVKRDLDAARGNPDRVPLFRLLDDSAPEPAAKPRTPRKAASGG